MVSIMPKKPGIYMFWNQNGEVIYVGSADQPNSLYVELNRHFDKAHSIPIDNIYDFQVEVCSNPNKQQIQYLENHKRDYGYLPDFNENSYLSDRRGE